jgi:AcrR family transcriptional regulator
MTELTRKQRQILERDDLILRKSRKLFLEHGYHDVTMDMIAREVEYSKGTIYQHYNCKEGIISALCLRFSEVVLEMFRYLDELGSIPGYLKMLMMIELEVVLHEYARPEKALINLLKADTFNTKLDKNSLIEMNCHVESILKQVIAIVQKAIDDGEISLNAPANAESIALGCWAMGEGTYEIADKHTHDEGGFTAKQVKRLLVSNSVVFLRGSGWHAIPVDKHGQLSLSKSEKKLLTKYRKHSEALVDEYHSAQHH